MRALALGVLVLGLGGCLQPTGFGTGTSTTGGATTGGGDTPPPPKDPNAALPTALDDFVTFLRERAYEAYPTTPSAVVPTGPHGVAGVRGYYHPTLADSLAMGALEHPAGSGAVLELYAADGVTRFGWAASVKLAAESDAGLNWLWLEAIETKGEVKLVDGGPGLGLCIPCHAAGNDFILGVGR